MLYILHIVGPPATKMRAHFRARPGEMRDSVPLWYSLLDTFFVVAERRGGEFNQSHNRGEC